MLTYILDRCKQALLNNQNSTHTATWLHYCPSTQTTLQVMALDRAINAASIIHSQLRACDGASRRERIEVWQTRLVFPTSGNKFYRASSHVKGKSPLKFAELHEDCTEWRFSATQTVVRRLWQEAVGYALSTRRTRTLPTHFPALVRAVRGNEGL